MVQEVQEEKGEKEKDVRAEESVPKKALHICDINEESMFQPDYQKEEEELEAEKVEVQKNV